MKAPVKALTLFGWLVVGSIAQAQESDPVLPSEFPPELEVEIENSVLAIQEERDIPGICVGIQCGDETVFAKAYGHANRSRSMPMTTDTPMMIGSLTKTFTATLLMILRDSDELTLDERVARFLPSDVPMPTGRSGRDVMTLRHLVTHVSGIPRSSPTRENVSFAGPIDPGVAKPMSIASLYEGLKQAELVREPGAAWEYSNFGMSVLGHCLERAADMPYDVLVADLLFDPLGMANSTIHPDDEYEARLAAHYWAQDPKRLERPRWVFGEIAGAGGIISTLNDLLKYAAFQLRRGAGPEDPLGPDSMEEMRKPLSRIGETRYQGIGWMVERAEPPGRWTCITHGGEVDGHSSEMIVFTEANLALVTLVNLGQDNAGAVARTVFEVIRNHLEKNG